MAILLVFSNLFFSNLKRVTVCWSLLLISEHFLTVFGKGGGMRGGRSGCLVSVRLVQAGMPSVPGCSAMNPLALFLCDCCDSFQWANSHILLQQKQLWKFFQSRGINVTMSSKQKKKIKKRITVWVFFFSICPFPDSNESFFKVVVWKKEGMDLGVCMCSICLLGVFGSIKDRQENKLFSRKNYACKEKKVLKSMSHKDESCPSPEKLYKTLT